MGIFIAAERDEGEPFADASDEQHGLFGADPALPGKPMDCRIG
ncbi:MAG TPA: hypothetical protein VGP62_02860 [Bryobacteraceae bacterium]|nr:hypothetical protein [Bryobacteraceae bacterium]